MGYPVQFNNTTRPLTFLMVLSVDHISGATGVTPTVTISKNGGAYGVPSGLVSEIGNGMYALAPSATDANTAGPLLLHAEAAGCDPRDETFDVVTYNPSVAQVSSPPTTATTGTTTALQIITRALRLIGAISHAESPNPAEAQDGLSVLNTMIDTWGSERLTIFEVKRETFPLTALTGTFTIGLGGDIDRARPIWIDGAGYIQSGAQPFELPLDILSTQQWQRQTIKTLQSTLPTQVYYDRAYPLGNLTYWPIPTDPSLTGVLYLPTAVGAFQNLVYQYAFPEGYLEAIVYNLAERFIPEYGREAVPLILKRAAESLGNIKRANIIIEELVVDRGLLFGQDIFNWRTGP